MALFALERMMTARKYDVKFALSGHDPLHMVSK